MNIAEDLRAKHTPEAIQSRLQTQQSPSYLRDFIYGAIDGTVTTFAVVASVAAIGFSSGIILLLGIANLVADGFSMAIGNYLGVKADLDEQKKAKRKEYQEVELYPEGEKEEIRQIYAAKGFEGELLEKVVEVITSNKEQWVDTMLAEEHSISKQTLKPCTSAAVTFFAFLCVGSIPLLFFVFDFFQPNTLSNPFLMSSILTALAFFLVGALKGKVVEVSWFKEGMQTLFFGACAASLAYFIGVLLKPYVGN